MKKIAIGTYVESKLGGINGLVAGYFEGRYKIMCANGETWYICQYEIKG
jgi:hypothetical protein